MYIQSRTLSRIKELPVSNLLKSGRVLLFLIAALLPTLLLAQINNPYDPANRERGLSAFEQKRYGDAMHLLRPFASQGDPAAEFVIGNIMAQGLGTPRNESLGLQYLMKSADHGYPRAQAAMGIRYVMGRGVPQDNCKALAMFRAAYAQDPKLVANEMGNMYKDGLCVDRDPRLAARYYAASPAPEADINRENLLHESTPEDKSSIERAAQFESRDNFAGALQVLKPLADRGEMHALEHLGYCYWFLDHSPDHFQLAAQTFQRAANQGSGYAQAMLGNLYEMGVGVSRDEARAFQLYQSSAGKKNSAGLFYLARAYEFGIGVQKDRDAAIRYYTQAGQQGNDRGAHFAEFLKDPNNVDYRTDAEYQAAVKAKAAAAARAAANVTCSTNVVQLYRGPSGDVSSYPFGGNRESLGPALRRSCAPAN
jgi:TPR repeat protein